MNVLAAPVIQMLHVKIQLAPICALVMMDGLVMVMSVVVSNGVGTHYNFCSFQYKVEKICAD